MTRLNHVPREQEELEITTQLSALASESLGFLSHGSDLWLADAGGRDAIRARAAHRLDALVEHARRHSGLYRDLYQGLAPGCVQLQQLPIVKKSKLMAQFDRWVTQPEELNLDALIEFTRDPALIGRPYLGQYAVWTSSGTTGSPGIFVQDTEALTVYEALTAVRSNAATRAMLRSLAAGGRFAYAAAIEGHFSGITMWRRMRLLNPWMTANSRAISVLEPVEDVCEQLSAFDPEILTSYPSELAALAEQQRCGRLALNLKGIWSGGETLSPRDRADIAGAFGCAVVNDYGASECLNIAYDCGCGALHVNSDWVILEPLDREGRPVADGTPSWTVLLTNLANFVQPIIRYDLGDSVTFLSEPCACGSSLPAIRVDGRCDDTICLQRDDGKAERMIPLALSTAIEEGAGVFNFQVLEEAPNSLVLRIDPSEADRDQAAARAEQSIRDFCAELGSHVSVRTDALPPQIDPLSGKLRRICARRAEERARSH